MGLEGVWDVWGGTHGSCRSRNVHAIFGPNLDQIPRPSGVSRVSPGQVAWQLFLAATVVRWLTRSLAGLPALEEPR